MTAFRRAPADILAELETLRAGDAPTHGGRVLSYVYDSGMPELDELAAAAARLVQPVNGLDPTTFTSVAAMESGLVGFARRVFHGEDEAGGVVVGSVTSGGTESCLLAVKSARDVWRSARAGTPRTPRLVAPVTVHAAFHKAAEYFGLALDLVPVDPDTGTLMPAAIEERLGDDVALVVMSAPSYPFASLDPVSDVAAICGARGIALHVDACIGGFALAFWPHDLPAWDLAVPGVTSLSADLHKYGYAPKGVSVLLTRGRDRQRHQYFATTGWPGYPVVNPTMAGSKPAGPLAAAWSIAEALGEAGFADLTARAAHATEALRTVVEGIEGLRVVGDPTGPLFAVATDDAVAPERRVDPHHWADAARGSGWFLQLQPGMVQADGTRLPHTTHLTVTPVTEGAVPELAAALVAAADAVRGEPPVDGGALLAGLAAQLPGGLDALAAASDGLDSDAAASLLGAFGLLGGDGAGGALPDRLAPVLALVEALPGPLTERLLVELLARVVEPRG
ncbi:glutamate/tyrosine decarboxylase-like PLP-dependent enzyme [Agromyces sp. 3263]|uniref:pyridoxal phosphate-dependent decarboxylase family protein n=1 Tax=Agromyces sp. 3263 TaxID=2817750 RepID=UPI002863504A|nr:aminotransferase class V-fold PLP-dependent enzyme [Agromyces sp. 3263]MDR6907894.1 glutamate/tyrosine decarboxylase-like PLP-dependent enzyme [Agromyces sp. 3263]